MLPPSLLSSKTSTHLWFQPTHLKSNYPGNPNCGRLQSPATYEQQALPEFRKPQTLRRLALTNFSGAVHKDGSSCRCCLWCCYLPWLSQSGSSIRKLPDATTYINYTSFVSRLCCNCIENCSYRKQSLSGRSSSSRSRRRSSKSSSCPCKLAFSWAHNLTVGTKQFQ